VGDAFAEQVQFGLRFLHLGLSLGLAAFINELAEAARMLAVKGFLQRGRQWFSPGESDRHANPGDGLEEEPVGASRQDGRKHHKTSSQAERHNNSIGQMREGSQLFPVGAPKCEWALRTGVL
jgi:hypothetical protein